MAASAGRPRHQGETGAGASRHSPPRLFGRRYHGQVVPPVLPQLVANDGPRALRQAIADPDRFACEPKVDGVRGLASTSRKEGTLVADQGTPPNASIT